MNEKASNIISQFIFLSFFFTSICFAETPQDQLESKEALETQKLSEVIVKSTTLKQTLLETAQPVTVIEQNQMPTKAKANLGQTLASEPGIAASSFGAGASRPIIRGLGGDRIKILENGVDAQDISNTSPDHASYINPSSANRIEVIRGPAALLYGTSTVGGIVNVFDNRIAETKLDSPLSGYAETKFGTVDQERSGSLNLSAPIEDFVFHLDTFSRKTDDYNIPGYARTDALRSDPEQALDFAEPRGKVPYSDTDTQDFALGSSYIFDKGFLGVAISEFNSDYGVPNGEQDISIDGKRQKAEIRGQIRELSDFVESADLKMGITDYDHTEFEGSETGTKFSQNSFDTRVDFKHKNLAGLQGSFGFQVQDSDLKAVGEEAYQPPTDSQVLSLFAFEDYKLNQKTNLEFAARYDHSDLNTDGFAEDKSDNLDKDFNTFGQSIGVVHKINKDYSTALSIAHTERAPSGQELFANGPHVATAAFEVGDPNLDKERSLGVDLSFRKNTGKFRGFIGGFFNHFWDYINLSPTQDFEDGLQVYRFEPVKANFIGFESQFAYFVTDSAGKEISFDIQPDYVFAKDLDNDQALPRIPPFRLKLGANFYNEAWLRARIELLQVFDQNRNSELETETNGYTHLNIYLSKNIFIKNQDLEIFITGTNLLNDKSRDHTSFIKDITPLPGASVISGVRFNF